MTTAKSTTKKVRADSARNRETLIDSAKRLFTANGAATSLDQIAREAGVGIGTLYRHFPTRDALVVAVYRHETEVLIAAATRLESEHSPLEALRAWLGEFAVFMATKHGLVELYASVLSDDDAPSREATTRVTTVFKGLLNAATQAGDIVVSAPPLDILRAVAGASTIAATETDRPATALIDVLLAGLRPRAAGGDR